VTWAPDGNAIVYEAIVRGKSHDLFLAPFPPQRGQVRNLGHWYQGFSFSPDAARIVHAINLPFALEVLDVATTNRTLMHKADNVVWEAQFSPDGKYIAYRKTVTEPQISDQGGKDDDEPDCANPPTELRLYSVADGSDTVVALHDLKAPDSVYNFSWSPDSRRIALELGTNDCGYPAGNAAVFVTSVDQKYQIRVSNASPALEPIFSRDNSAVVFVDSSQPPARLLRYEFPSKTLKLIRRAEESEGYYRLLDWK
jgi:Tol biopolymer transport system component